MTLDEFQNKFKKNTRFDKYWYHGLCYLTIAGGLFMLYSDWTNSIVESADKSFPHAFGFIFLIVVGVYGLIVLRNKFKLTIWQNGLTKEKNLELIQYATSEMKKTTIEKADNYIYFIYRKAWWRMPYEIHLFADANLIAINVEGQDYGDGGFIDFGASKRTQKGILKLMSEKAYR